METKWSVVKLDVVEFASHHAQCEGLRESGTSEADVIAQALDLYQLRNSGGALY